MDEWCSGKHKCIICRKIKPCTGTEIGHAETHKGTRCNVPNHDMFCQDCQDDRWDDILVWYKVNRGIII